MDVAVACGIGPGIMVAVNAGEVGDACGSTIVAVGEIGIGIGAQEVRIKAIMRKFDVRFIFSPRRKKNAKKPKPSRNLKDFAPLASSRLILHIPPRVSITLRISVSIFSAFVSSSASSFNIFFPADLSSSELMLMRTL